MRIADTWSINISNAHCGSGAIRIHVCLKLLLNICRLWVCQQGTTYGPSDSLEARPRVVSCGLVVLQPSWNWMNEGGMLWHIQRERDKSGKAHTRRKAFEQQHRHMLLACILVASWQCSVHGISEATLIMCGEIAFMHPYPYISFKSSVITR